MVDVEYVENQNTIQGTSSFFHNFIKFFHDNWMWLLIFIILMILGIVIYYLLVKAKEDWKERDEPGYQLFKNVKRTCKLQADKRLIKKKWSPINLLWLGIPLIKRERSAKIIDRSDNLIGYYRGAYVSQDNTMNILTYKKKHFLFFEDLFIIKFPLVLKFKTTKKDEHGRILYQNDNKTPIYVSKNVNLGRLIHQYPNNNIKLDCISIERVGLYYYCPVFLIDSEKGYLDYRKALEGVIIDNTYQTMVQRVLNVGARQMEKGMMFSPHLQYAQKAPEKTKEEIKMDEYS